jgi:hypothetical protein
MVFKVMISFIVDLEVLSSETWRSSMYKSEYNFSALSLLQAHPFKMISVE